MCARYEHLLAIGRPRTLMMVLGTRGPSGCDGLLPALLLQKPRHYITHALGLCVVDDILTPLPLVSQSVTETVGIHKHVVVGVHWHHLNGCVATTDYS